MREDPDFHIYFVGLVEQYPCIYDYNCMEYRNKSTQENAWNKIATEISESVHDCKERWKNLRGSYTRHLKSVYGDGKRRPYYLADHLSFLHPFTKTRAMKLNDTSPASLEQDSELHPPIETKYLQDINSQSSHQSSCEEDSASASSLATTAPRNKRKGKLVSYETMLAKRTSTTNDSTTTSNSSDGQNPDPDYSFLLSVLPDMQEMNGEQKRRFKIGILNLAGQILKKT